MCFEQLCYKSWWQWLAKDSGFKELLLSVNKRGMNCDELDIHANHIGTLWEYIYTLQVVSFLVFCAKMHPWNSDALLAPLHAPHDVISMKTMPPCGRAPLIYILSKLQVYRTDSSRVTAISVSSPLFCWSDHWRHGLRTNPTAAHHPVCPGHSWCHC